MQIIARQEHPTPGRSDESRRRYEDGARTLRLLSRVTVAGLVGLLAVAVALVVLLASRGGR